jgi:arylformamidase
MPEKRVSQPKWGEAARSSWIDISIPLKDKMIHWPTDPVPRIERLKDRDKGDPVSLMELQIVDHVGTHVDAPLHFIPGGMTIDKMPLNATIGRARVIEIKDRKAITLKELAPHNLRRGERILFKTRNSSLYKTGVFTEDYVYFSTEVAQHLVDRGVRVVGLDYISIGTPADRDNIRDTHSILLGGGIYVIEGLDLSNVKAGRYELVCLPLRLERGDAGPARAILRPV